MSMSQHHTQIYMITHHIANNSVITPQTLNSILLLAHTVKNISTIISTVMFIVTTWEQMTKPVQHLEVHVV